MSDIANTRFRPDIDMPNPAWTRPLAVAGFVVVLIAIKLAMAVATDFVRDEAYYSLWALHPLQWGYFDHPPAVAWFIATGFGLVGESELAARLFGILSVAPVSFAIWRIAQIIFADRRIAAFAVYAFNLTPGGLLGLLVITPDAPSILFWALAIWSAAELIRSGDGRWWLALGLFAGLGLAAKYTGLFLGAGIIAWLVAHRSNRRWFASPWLYAGGALAMVIFAPVVVWNLENGLSSFAFQFGRSSRGLVGYDWTQMRHLPEFLAGQVGLLLPGLFALVAIAHGLFARRRDLRSNPGFGLLIWTGVPALIYFLLFSLHSGLQGNWTWPFYAQWSILGAWAIFGWTTPSRIAQWLQRWTLRLQVPVGAAIAVLVFVQALAQPIRLPFSDQTRAMAGWAGVAAATQTYADRIGAGTVLARDYGLYGYLESYGRFGGHAYRALPLDEFHRYGFVDLPAHDDALAWPVLVAAPAIIGEPSEPPAAILMRYPAAEPLTRIIRLGADGTPAGAIDLYELEKPTTPLFGG